MLLHPERSKISFIAFVCTLLSFSQEICGKPRLLPTHYFIFGDKYAGVNYLSKILNSTSPPLPLQECQVIPPQQRRASITDDQNKQLHPPLPPSWRHGFFTINDLKKNLDCDFDKTLFIMIVKDVRSMLCSVAKRKFQTSTSPTNKKLKQMYLNALVVHRLDDDNGDDLDLNGGTTVPSKINSYLKMRAHKLQLHYSMISRAKHGVVTRYEDILDDQNTEVKNILRGHGLTIGSIEASNFTSNRSNAKEECYKFFTPSLYTKTVKKSNKRLETKLGYPMVQQKKDPQHRFHLIYILMEFLWWIIVPTLIVLFFFAIYLLCREIRHQYFSNIKTNRKDASKRLKRNLDNKSRARPHWIEVMERSTGRMYYVNTSSGKIQWNRPSSTYVRYSGLDPKWKGHTDYFKVANQKIK